MINQNHLLKVASGLLVIVLGIFSCSTNDTIDDVTLLPYPLITETSVTEPASIVSQNIDSTTPETSSVESSIAGAIYESATGRFVWSTLTIKDGEIREEDVGFLSIDSKDNYSIKFSHYSEQIAYWTNDGLDELWISDIANKSPLKVLTGDQLSTGQNFDLQWSPDDQFLFVYTSSENSPHMIYDLDKNVLSDWYWICNSVIVSSLSNQLALSCELDNTFENTEKEKFAILEWGGEIWYTSEPINELISETLDDGTTPWRFSPNGKSLAYFDPMDSNAHISIADSTGNITRILPNSSLLQLNPAITSFESRYFELIPEREIGFFRWSFDGKKLLAHVLGNDENSCRSLRLSEGEELLNFPCWQVIDIETEKILWTDLDSENSLFRDNDEIATLRLTQAEFSPDGKMIAVKGQYFSNHLLSVIDLESSLAHRLQPLPSSTIYWAKTIP